MKWSLQRAFLRNACILKMQGSLQTHDPSCYSNTECPPPILAFSRLCQREEVILTRGWLLFILWHLLTEQQSARNFVTMISYRGLSYWVSWDQLRPRSLYHRSTWFCNYELIRDNLCLLGYMINSWNLNHHIRKEICRTYSFIPVFRVVPGQHHYHVLGIL